MEQMAVYKRYSETVSDSIIFMVIDYLKYKNVDYIVAPYEADSQLAYLYHTKQIKYIISEDSDMIAYNCFKLIKGLKSNGECFVMITPKKKSNPSKSLLAEFLKIRIVIR